MSTTVEKTDFDEGDADTFVAGTESFDGSPPSVLTEEAAGTNIHALLNVELDVRIILGRCRLPISDLLELTRGSVIELDRKVGDPVDVLINDRLVARGDLIKVNHDNIGVALREIVKEFVAPEKS